jgi:phage/plasmid-associated DNA primase
MLQELPGILNRWVAAYQRLTGRGHFQPSAADIAREFETRSDRVLQWLDEAMIITPATPGATLPVDKCRTAHELHTEFNRWADRDNSPRVKMSTVTDRLRTVPGVTDEVWKPNRARAWNIAPRPEGFAQFAQFQTTSSNAGHKHGEEEESETHRGNGSKLRKLRKPLAWPSTWRRLARMSCGGAAPTSSGSPVFAVTPARSRSLLTLRMSRS